LSHDEASSEFRPKLASLQNRISSHSSTRRHSPRVSQQARGGRHFWIREALEPQKTDTTPLLHLLPSDDLKSAYFVARFFDVCFQEFVVWVSFIDCKGSTPWAISDAPNVSVGWRLHSQMLMNPCNILCAGYKMRNDAASYSIQVIPAVLIHQLMAQFVDFYSSLREARLFGCDERFW
jgi:hypothetical protein